MSVERSLEAWEGMQRQGQDFADRFNSLAQGFTGLIHSHMNSSGFSWPNHQESKSFDVEILNQSTEKRDLGLLATDSSGINGVSAIFDFGNRLGQASAEFGACLNGVVQQFFRRLPLAFRQDENDGASLRVDSNYRNKDQFLDLKIEDAGSVGDLWKGCGTNRPSYGFAEPEGDPDESSEEESSGFHLKSPGYFSRPQGSINITSVYDSRTHGIESSVVAKGDLWRAEASHGSSTSGNESSPLFLIQLGPVLFIRDTTLLLPVHLSKQHLLWYGFDRKNGMHSLCPAVWSKHRRWLLMSMISLNPLACSKVIQMQETKRSVHALALFRGRILNRKIALNDKIEMTPEILQDEAGIHLSFMDLQFPNGQLTYVVGEGLTTSAFLPVFGGLLQAQGRCPGETRFSFSCKNKRGTRITSTVQWPSRSLSLGVVQALAWERTGLMVRPTVQFSICPTFGGSNPGLRAELIHSMKEKLNLICGYSCTAHPSAFASVALGRSKWNGHVGSSGIVVRVETPIGNVGRPSFSVQLNSGVEF